MTRTLRLSLFAFIAACLGVASLAAAVPSATGSAARSLSVEHHALAFTPPKIGQLAKHPVAVHGSKYNQNGYNWSGYVDTGSFTSVTSNWTEPSVTCNSTNDLFAPWVGIDGYSSTTVEQTGVATDCSSGRPVDQGWYEMYPASPVYYSNAVAAGDKITATVTRSGSAYTLTLKDTTKGWTKTVTKSLVAARHVNAEVIMESPTASYPNFHAVTFTGSKANGSTLGSFSHVALDASNNNGYEDHTSALTSGTNFSITYEQE